MKKLTLQDLTKEELIRLIESHAFFTVRERDILDVRRESLNARAQAKRKEAVALGWNIENFYKTEKIWQEGERLQKQSDELYKQREAYK